MPAAMTGDRITTVGCAHCGLTAHKGRGGSFWMTVSGAQAPSDKQQGIAFNPSEKAPANTGNGRDRERPQHQRAVGFLSPGTARTPFPSLVIL
jgi:hypothetical protein